MAHLRIKIPEYKMFTKIQEQIKSNKPIVDIVYNAFVDGLRKNDFQDKIITSSERIHIVSLLREHYDTLDKDIQDQILIMGSENKTDLEKLMYEIFNEYYNRQNGGSRRKRRRKTRRKKNRRKSRR